MRALSPAVLAYAPSGARAPVLGSAFAWTPACPAIRSAGPDLAVVAEPNDLGIEGAQPVDRTIVGLDIRRPGSSLQRRRIAGPFGCRVTGLAGQDDEARTGSNRERLMTGRVAGRREDPDVIRHGVVAIELLVARTIEVDPFEDRVVGRVGDLPLRPSARRSGCPGRWRSVRRDRREGGSSRRRRSRQDPPRPRAGRRRRGPVAGWYRSSSSAFPNPKPVSKRRRPPACAERDRRRPRPWSPAISSSGNEKVPSSSGMISAPPASVTGVRQSLRQIQGQGGGGEGGIRTRDGLPRTAFPVRRHSPLGDLSGKTVRPAVSPT